jgi:hypothetical protein
MDGLSPSLYTIPSSSTEMHKSHGQEKSTHFEFFQNLLSIQYAAFRYKTSMTECSQIPTQDVVSYAKPPKYLRTVAETLTEMGIHD